MDGKLREDGGKTYMDIEKFDFQFDPKKMRMHFENLFDGNKELGRFNDFLRILFAVISVRLTRTYLTFNTRMV